MSESPKDKFEELFRMQQSLNARIGVHHTTGMSEEEQTKWLLNYTRAMSQEMAELTDSVPVEMVGQIPRNSTQQNAQGGSR